MNRKEPFEWQRFYAYLVFENLLERFVIQLKGYSAWKIDSLLLTAASNDMQARIIGVFENVNNYVVMQLASTSEQTSKRANEQTQIISQTKSLKP